MQIIWIKRMKCAFLCLTRPLDQCQDIKKYIFKYYLNTVFICMHSDI